jgi:hypothetical protein
MIRAGLRIAMVAALMGIGWMAAKAQTSEPDFELIVNAPNGETTIECVRGCELAWVQRGLNANSKPMPKFLFGCGGGAVGGDASEARCSSFKVGGWIKR